MKKQCGIFPALLFHHLRFFVIRTGLIHGHPFVFQLTIALVRVLNEKPAILALSHAHTFFIFPPQCGQGDESCCT